MFESELLNTLTECMIIGTSSIALLAITSENISKKQQTTKSHEEYIASRYEKMQLAYQKIIELQDEEIAALRLQNEKQSLIIKRQSDRLMTICKAKKGIEVETA